LEGGDDPVGTEGDDAAGDPPQAAMFAPALPDQPGTADLGERSQHEQRCGLGDRHNSVR
jgi:hypothetical protein